MEHSSSTTLKIKVDFETKTMSKLQFYGDEIRKKAQNMRYGDILLINPPQYTEVKDYMANKEKPSDQGSSLYTAEQVDKLVSRKIYYLFTDDDKIFTANTLNTFLDDTGCEIGDDENRMSNDTQHISWWVLCYDKKKARSNEEEELLDEEEKKVVSSECHTEEFLVERKDLSEQIKRLTTDREIARAEVETGLTKISELESQIQALTKDNDALRQQVANGPDQTSSTTPTALQDEISKLQNEILALKESYKQEGIQEDLKLTQLKQDMMVANTELNEINVKYDVTKQATEELEQQRLTYLTQAKQLKTSIHNGEQTKTELQQQVQALRTERDGLQNQIATLNDQIKNIGQAKIELQQTQQELKSVSEILTNAKDEVAAVQTQLQEKQREQDDVREQLDKDKHMLTTLTIDQERLKQELDNGQTELAKIEEMAAEAGDRANRAEEACDKATAQYEELRESINAAQEHHDRLLSKIKDSEEYKVALEAQLEECKVDISQYQDVLTAMSTLHKKSTPAAATTLTSPETASQRAQLQGSTHKARTGGNETSFQREPDDLTS